MGYVLTALESVVHASEHATAVEALSLPILPESERRCVVEGFNSTAVSFPHEKLIHELFEEQVECTSDAVAVVHKDRSLTYAQINADANQLARYLKYKGVGPDQLVGICVERNLEMIVGLLAILKAGGAYVPLDPNYPAERMQYMIMDAKPAVLLTQARLRQALRTTATEIVALDDEWSEIAKQPTGNLDVESLCSDHLAYVIYTSGSTGTPKGVAIEHRNAVNLICWAQSALDRQTFAATLQATSLNFDLSVYECFVSLATGGAIHVVENALALVKGQSEVTLINTVPSAIAGIVEAGRLPDTARVVNLAGEALKKEVVDRIFSRSQVEQVCNLYGPSETTTYSTYISMRREEGFVATIGHPIANTQIYILDRRQQPVPIGVAGEIYIAGVGVARGYLNRPDLTAERFITNPFYTGPGARMYKTGDLGRWLPDGSIEYLGRNDHQVKVRGFRIELGEIEAQLLKHGLKEAVVVAREDVPGEKRLVAYMTPRDLGVPSAEELRSHLQAVLPQHMVPGAFVLLPRFPLTPNGKLDRRALPAPDLEAYATRKYEPPLGDVEKVLARIWQTLLRVERVGRHDNFFAIGGHSLLVVQMMDRLRKTGLSVEFRSVYDSPTLAALANAIRDEAAVQFEVPPNLIPPGCATITPQMLPLVALEPEHIEFVVQTVAGGAANIQDIYPLGPLQEGILFHHLLDNDGRDTYVLPTLVSFCSRKRLEDFIEALRTVIDRHDVLRTAVLWERLPRPVQVVYRQAPLRVEHIVLNPDRDPIAQLKESMKPEQQSLNLHNAPLLRLLIAADAGGMQWYALLQLHHLAGDHESIETLFAEVADCLEGRAQQLPEAVHYRDYIAQTLTSERVQAADREAFFRSKLEEIGEPTAPFGLLNVHGNSSRIEEAHEELDPELGRRVHAQARRLSVSPAMVFHAAWGLVVAHTSGRDDVVYGTLLLGRMQDGSGTQRMLGLHINTLPLRLRLRGVTAKELLEQTQRELVELLDHEQASLAVAQRCSSVAGTAPLFTALLNYRHVTLPLETGQPSLASGVQVLASLEWTNYPIVLSVGDLSSGFTLTAQTDRRINPRRILSYISVALQSLVAALEEAPQRLALSLSIMPDNERHQVIEVFNATQAAYPQDVRIHELFEEHVRRSPDAIAAQCGETSLTYVNLNEQANQLSHYLSVQGVQIGEYVPILMARSLQLLVSQLALLKCGAVYVPLDPKLPQERQAFIIRDCGARRVVTEKGLAVESKRASVQWIDYTQFSATPGLPKSNRTLKFGVRSSAYVMYTSGSTGTPKGVVVPHRAVNRLALNNGYARIEPADCLAHCSNPAFDASTFEIWGALLNGARVVIVPESTVLEAESFATTLEQQCVTVLWLTVGLLANYTQALTGVYAKLRYLLTGGDIVEPWVAGHVLRNGPPGRLLNAYGPTECTTFSTTFTIKSVDADTNRLPIGSPISNTQIYVLDSLRQPVPIGVGGEIYIGGDGVAQGYLNRPELTAERFIAHPFSSDPHARLYKTGDMGLWRADGMIEYLGRNDHQVKLRGFRVELGEIEAQLMLNANVKEAIVVAREVMRGEKRLVAYITRHNGSGPDAENLRNHLKAVLPEYMVPSAFVTLERMPLTPHGKLDRRALPAPDLAAFTSYPYEAPEGEVEEIVAEIWQEILHTERIGRDDNFFGLGGHSLLAMRLISRVREQLDVDVAVRDLFEAATLKEFAARVVSQASRTNNAEVANHSAKFGRDVNEMSDQEILAEIVKRQDELSGQMGESRPTPDTP